MKDQYMVYVMRSQDVRQANLSLDENYSFQLWKPRIQEMVPKDLADKRKRINGKQPFLYWSILHYLKLFKNTDYSIFMVYQGKEIIHHSIILPAYFRIPFMAENDLQIGPCLTDVEHQKKGIASYVIKKVFDLYKDRDRNFWYITREENTISRHFAEKNGFILYGRSVKKMRFGFIEAHVIYEKYS